MTEQSSFCWLIPAFLKIFLIISLSESEVVRNENYGDFSAKMKELGISVSYIGTTWSGANMMFDGEMWNEIHGKGWDNFLEIK